MNWDLEWGHRRVLVHVSDPTGMDAALLPKVQRGLRHIPEGRLPELDAYLRSSLRPLGEVTSVDFGPSGVEPYAQRITVVLATLPREPGHR